MRRSSRRDEFEGLLLRRRHAVIAGAERLEDVELLTNGLGKKALGHLNLAYVIAPEKDK